MSADPPMIQLFCPTLGRAEVEAVAKVFASTWVGRGPVTEAFEADFATHLGVDRRHVTSITSCTEALFQSMALLGIAAGDEVILPSISFVGAANAVVAAGAAPVFCDVDPRTLNATGAAIAERITARTKAAIVLHYGGAPSEMDGIVEVARSSGIALIEDSACSVASTYRGRTCGTIGDIGVWSFDAMKILVTGDGGMIYCASAELTERARRLIHLGLATPTGYASEAPDRWWELEAVCAGRRAILNDITAAIGREQLAKLPSFVGRRAEIHRRYDAAFAGLDWLDTPPPLPAHTTSSYYLYWVQLAEPGRDRLARFLRDRGIYTTFRYYPLHRVALYGHAGPLPAADRAADRTLCLPLHQGLSNEDVERVIDAVHAFGRTI